MKKTPTVTLFNPYARPKNMTHMACPKHTKTLCQLHFCKTRLQKQCHVRNQKQTSLGTSRYPCEGLATGQHSPRSSSAHCCHHLPLSSLGLHSVAVSTNKLMNHVENACHTKNNHRSSGHVFTYEGCPARSATQAYEHPHLTKPKTNGLLKITKTVPNNETKNCMK